MYDSAAFSANVYVHDYVTDRQSSPCTTYIRHESFENSQNEHQRLYNGTSRKLRSSGDRDDHISIIGGHLKTTGNTDTNAYQTHNRMWRPMGNLHNGNYRL